MQRTVLDREIVEVETPYGRVKVKLGRWQGEIVTRSPEYENCLALAQARQVSVRAVFEAACQAARSAGPAASHPERPGAKRKPIAPRPRHPKHRH